MYLTLNNGVKSLLKIDAHPALGGTALLRLSRPSPALAKERRRIGFCLVELLDFYNNGCEIPLAGGILERYHLFLR